ncbi:hypothetical protein PVSEL_1402960 [Plasmodium vinckei]|uniref:Uncharacterized protein n=1 Tax=Plasmodium vinckei TaxID=5860 RepID=A0A6V7TG42_PLAVN|nr:hypothetical protein PVSEL_1402960 [Plasmodium vinckei]
MLYHVTNLMSRKEDNSCSDHNIRTNTIMFLPFFSHNFFVFVYFPFGCRPFFYVLPFSHYSINFDGNVTILHVSIISHNLSKIKKKRWVVSIRHYKIQDCMITPHRAFILFSYENMFLHNT